MVKAWAPTAVAADVYCVVRRADEVLSTMPVADADRRETAAMPAWRAVEYVAARTLLRALLAEATGNRGAVRIAARASGQPYLPDRPEDGISLSHSDGWLAAAAGIGVSVGVDVQMPAETGPRLPARCCRPEDAERLAREAPAGRDLEFAWLWTAKEACTKAVGTGLSGLPWTVPVAPVSLTGTWQGVVWHALRDSSPVPASCAYTTATGGVR